MLNRLPALCFTARRAGWREKGENAYYSTQVRISVHIIYSRSTVYIYFFLIIYIFLIYFLTAFIAMRWSRETLRLLKGSSNPSSMVKKRGKYQFETSPLGSNPRCTKNPGKKRNQKTTREGHRIPHSDMRWLVTDVRGRRDNSNNGKDL
jgi:hypothetical protein